VDIKGGRIFDYVLLLDSFHTRDSRASNMHLGFDQLDDLAFAISVHRSVESSHLRLLPNHLGPLLELDWLKRGGLAVPALAELGDSRRLRLLRAIIEGERSAAFEVGNARSKLLCCHWERDDEPDDWFFFCKSLQDAASMIGFPRRNAEELVAGTRELVANIFDHSGASTTGIAGYAVVDNHLEIVIADEGIGVLQSLRTSPEFEFLRDSGEALEAALTDGNSRYGSSAGHGGGFRALFRGLANLSSSLRFRSGDHALTIEGISPGLSKARISQKVQLPGFLISIMCR
jgi:hypothetical protein